MREIEKNGSGMIVHMPKQDGRGMGLSFKLGTLMLQDELGYDTIEAAAALKGMKFIEPEALDPRTYGGVIAILRFFDLDSRFGINIATNNPKKIRAFAENGYSVERTPVIIPPNEYTSPPYRQGGRVWAHVKRGQEVSFCPVLFSFSIKLQIERHLCFCCIREYVANGRMNLWE
jgi:GTP cyclohydrolase II